MATSPSVHATTSPQILASPMQIDEYTSDFPMKGQNIELPTFTRTKYTDLRTIHSALTRKKPRTVAIKSTFHQTPINTQPQSTSANTTTCKLSIQDNMESQEEKQEREATLHELFSSMMSTYSLSRSSANESTMKEFKEIFAVSSCEMEDLLPSAIYYMDENPDNKETMRHLSELLVENASSPCQDNFVILVGDGKTYEHLMHIKHLCGAELDKLIFSWGLAHSSKLPACANEGILPCWSQRACYELRP